MQPALYIIPTPIGNLKDITLRAIETLENIDIVACEDTRVTQKLLNHLGIKKKLFIYNDHSKETERQKILDFINEGKSVGLVSDAGTPMISDPGYKLVLDAVKQGIKIFPIAGVSATIAALSVCGLPTDNFYFAGFLPSKQGERVEKLKNIKNIKSTIIFFESPNRLGKMLADCYKVFSDRPATIVRELTKLFEEKIYSTLKNLVGEYENKEVKGEIVVIIDNNFNDEKTLSNEEIIFELQKLKQNFSVKDSAKIAEETLGISKKQAYKILLDL